MVEKTQPINNKGKELFKIYKKYFNQLIACEKEKTIKKDIKTLEVHVLLLTELIKEKEKHQSKYQKNNFSKQEAYSTEEITYLRQRATLILNEYIKQLRQIMKDGGGKKKEETREIYDVFSQHLYKWMAENYNNKELGQVYTPPLLAQFMAEIALTEPKDKIMDPAAGTGILLFKINKKREELWKEENYKEILPNERGFTTIGIEYDKQTFCLCRELLRLNSERNESNLIIREDFFNIPEQPEMDAIIANPPYIKQERIPNKKQLFTKLKKYLEKKEISKRMDYYGLFLVKSRNHLKVQGKLVFLVPNKWMDVKYGEEIKKYLINNFQIVAIIGFDKNQFPPALVSSVVIVAIKEDNKRKREQNIIHFLLLSEKKQLDATAQYIKRIIKEKTLSSPSTLPSIPPIFHPAFVQYSRLNKIKEQAKDYYFIELKNKNKEEKNSKRKGEDIENIIKLTFCPQKLINYKEKWTYKYLFQSTLLRILEKKKKEGFLLPMNNNIITKVKGGLKTGANDFFFPSQETIEQFKIARKYLIPGIKNGRQLSGHYVLKKAPAYFLSIPPLFEEKRRKETTKTVEEQHIITFIEYTEKTKNYHKRPSVRWKPWYSIPPSQYHVPDIIFLRHIDRTFKAYHNKIQAVTADGIRGIEVLEKKYIPYYLAFCNSTFFYWQLHIIGRWEGQGDLQLLVYELNQLLIPDARKISEEQLKEIKETMNQLIEFSKKDKKQKMRELKHQLDKQILQSMNLVEYYETLTTELKNLQYLRLEKSKR